MEAAWSICKKTRPSCSQPKAPNSMTDTLKGTKTANWVNRKRRNSKSWCRSSLIKTWASSSWSMSRTRRDARCSIRARYNNSSSSSSYDRGNDSERTAVRLEDPNSFQWSITALLTSKLRIRCLELNSIWLQRGCIFQVRSTCHLGRGSSSSISWTQRRPLPTMYIQRIWWTPPHSTNEQLSLWVTSVHRESLRLVCSRLSMVLRTQGWIVLMLIQMATLVAICAPSATQPWASLKSTSTSAGRCDRSTLWIAIRTKKSWVIRLMSVSGAIKAPWATWSTLLANRMIGVPTSAPSMYAISSR